MKFLNRKLFLILFFAALTVFLVIIAFLTEGPYIGTDSVNHFYIARNAFRDPAYFLDPWGRPLYTILTSPFTLIGFIGSMLFNVAAAVLTGWLAYRIARELKPEAPLMATIMVVFTPIYTVMIFNAMTETLFGFMLMLGAWLFLRKKYYPAAIVYSLMPLVRNEGYILIPFMFLALLYVKQYKPILFLATGFVVFSLVGIPLYHDPFWLITRFPYPVAEPHPVYTERGSFFHFFRAWPYIFELPLTIFLLLGILVMAADTIFPRGALTRNRMVQVWLVVALPFIFYFLFHTILFWQAMGSSTGRVRFISAACPLAAMIAWWGYTLINRILWKDWLRIIGFLVISVWIIYTGLNRYPLPPPLGPEEKIIVEASRWLNENRKPEQRLFYTDLRIPFFMGLNGFDKDACNCSWYFMPAGFKWFRPGDILVWESHFGPNECNAPLDTFRNHPDFRLIHFIEPVRPMTTMKNRLYELYIFQRTPPGTLNDNDRLQDSIREAMVRGFDTIYLGGADSVRMDEGREFSPGVMKMMKDLSPVKERLCVKASVKAYSDEGFGGTPASLVLSLTDSTRMVNYSSIVFDKPPLPAGQWNEIKMTVWLDEILSDRYELKVYVWNPAGKSFYLKDLKAILLVPPQKN